MWSIPYIETEVDVQEQLRVGQYKKLNLDSGL